MLNTSLHFAFDTTISLLVNAEPRWCVHALWLVSARLELPCQQVVDRCALTRMAWSPDGRRLCVGDAKVCQGVFRPFEVFFNTKNFDTTRNPRK